MIDFRYHLISLVAVILALALGILAGSGFLGGPFLERLQREVDRAEERNRELGQVITAQDELLAQQEAFARASAPLLVRGKLVGEEIVLMEIADSDDGLGEETRRVLLEAGAEIVSEVIFLPKLAMSSDPSVDELSLITGSFGNDPDAILEEAAALVGERAATAAADEGPTSPPSSGADQRFTSLLGELEEAGFVNSVLPEEGPSVPTDASFVVVGGSQDRAPFQTNRFVSALSAALAGRGAAAMVVEPSRSTWGLVTAVVRDVEARAAVATVDNGETTVGQIAVVLGLDEATNGTIGHFGTEPGAAIIPAAVPSG